MADFQDPTLPGDHAALGVLTSPAEQNGSSALLTQLAQDFRQQKKKLELDVPGRTGYAVTYDAVIAYELYRAWVIESTDVTGVDQLALAIRALAMQCTAITKDGQPLRVNDQPLTFDHKALQDTLGALDTSDCIRRFYGSDGVVLKASALLLDEAGYGASGDPTRR